MVKRIFATLAAIIVIMSQAAPAFAATPSSYTHHALCGRGAFHQSDSMGTVALWYETYAGSGCYQQYDVAVTVETCNNPQTGAIVKYENPVYGSKTIVKDVPITCVFSLRNPD